MRASRLLLLLLLVQNRGRMTARTLADELEVSTRTILRDVDALAEAGLPMIVHRGRRGGIELGFNYRTRLTGLSSDEAEALGVLLARHAPELAVLGIEHAAARAATKLLESLPDGSRQIAWQAAGRFRLEGVALPKDERVRALAAAVRGRRIVRIRSRDPDPRPIHPVALLLRPQGWAVVDALHPDLPIPLSECGTINVSNHVFDDQDRYAARPGPKFIGP